MPPDPFRWLLSIALACALSGTGSLGIFSLGMEVNDGYSLLAVKKRLTQDAEGGCSGEILSAMLFERFCDSIEEWSCYLGLEAYYDD